LFAAPLLFDHTHNPPLIAGLNVYLRAYDSVSVARESLGRYLTFYNTRRPHSSLDGQTPSQAYHIKPQPALSQTQFAIETGQSTPGLRGCHLTPFRKR
jgi:hypothetical protein